MRNAIVNHIFELMHRNKRIFFLTGDMGINLIEKFEEKSGIPILINTSLNVKGEPIVESPDDAVDLFKRSDVDILVINNKMWIKNA